MTESWVITRQVRMHCSAQLDSTHFPKPKAELIDKGAAEEGAVPPHRRAAHRKPGLRRGHFDSTLLAMDEPLAKP
jgi:hypothetical protein